MRDRRELGATFVGGFVGAVARAELAVAVPSMPGRWPWATFAVNVAGALLLGYLMTRPDGGRAFSPLRRPLLATGFCGGLTTFSTMQLELLRMLDAGDLVLACAYALTSVVAGLLAVALTTGLVRRARLAP